MPVRRVWLHAYLHISRSHFQCIWRRKIKKEENSFIFIKHSKMIPCLSACLLFPLICSISVLLETETELGIITWLGADRFKVSKMQVIILWLLPYCAVVLVVFGLWIIAPLMWKYKIMPQSLKLLCFRIPTLVPQRMVAFLVL